MYYGTYPKILLVTLLAPPYSQQLEVLSVKLQLYTFAGKKHTQR